MISVVSFNAQGLNQAEKQSLLGACLNSSKAAVSLDLLRRDSTGLERALQDAGLKTGGEGLQFSLRDQSFNGGQNGDSRSSAAQAVAIDDTLPAVDVGTSSYTRYIGRIGGVDIRV